MASSKLFKEFAFQIIDHVKKRIIYTDDEKYLLMSNIEVYPIDFRICINPMYHKRYKIITE